MQKLSADLWKTFGKLPLKGHMDYAPTACPGRWYSQLGKIAEMAESYYNGNTPTTASTVAPTVNASRTVEQLAREVLAGNWGTGQDRLYALENAGYDYNAVQARVNAIVLGTPTVATKSITDIAHEVINGDWGNGQNRFDRLTNAGYNANVVQAEVNRLLA